MNQILVTQKLYITPELKRKKKLYKLEFLISVFLVCVLFTYYIYAEYDKTRSEMVSKDILSEINAERPRGTDDTTIQAEENNVLIVALDPTARREVDIAKLLNDKKRKGSEKIDFSKLEKRYTNSGHEYYSIGIINIPKLGVNYPILYAPSYEATDELIKIAPAKFWGPDPNEVGNFCIVGHNYKNSKFFSKVPTLESGDIIEITDIAGNTINYLVYDKFVVSPDDVACTSQLTEGKKEITLITCTNDTKQRYIIKATEIK